MHPILALGKYSPLLFPTNAQPTIISSTNSITPTQSYLLSPLATCLTLLIQSRTRQQKNFIALLAVIVSETISISSQHQKRAPSSMPESSLSQLAHMPLFLKPRGKPINHIPAKFLDVVHLNIAFGNCLSIGGFKYGLIFVDQATQYNWCFGLKSLHSNKNCAAFLAF